MPFFNRVFPILESLVQEMYKIEFQKLSPDESKTIAATLKRLGGREMKQTLGKSDRRVKDLPTLKLGQKVKWQGKTWRTYDHDAVHTDAPGGSLFSLWDGKDTLVRWVPRTDIEP